MSGADGLWQFLYDVNGMRTLRTDYINYITYRYVYNGSQLTQMSKNNDTLYFAYDAAGKPLSFTYGIATYYYVTNLQGDVVAILDSSGSQVVGYAYDAWGNVLSVTGSMASTLGYLNPLTYRGYVYDWETGLYYLQSRYYNPEWGRFINADGYTSTGQGILGNNMFAYCGNNPISRIDPEGTWTISLSFGIDITCFFFGVSISIGIAIDDDANVAVQWSYSAPNYVTNNETTNFGVLDAGVGVSLQVTDDDTVHDLEGPTTYAGFSAGAGPYYGVDMVYSGLKGTDLDNDDTLPNGIQISAGYGIGFDTHYRQPVTKTLWIWSNIIK